MTDNNVVQFEFFKAQKELDKDYPKFLGHAERVFKTKTTPDEIFRRIYYTLRYLEGHIKAIEILSILWDEDIRAGFNERGKKYLVDWLEDILRRLKGEE